VFLQEQGIAEKKVVQFVVRLLLESKKALQGYVAIDNAIRQISQWHYSLYIVMQQLFHCSLQTTTASQQQWWEEKWDE
jgi:hypothetical protein